VARQRNYEGGRTGGRTKEEKTKRSGGAWQVVPYPAVSELKRADAMVRRSARLLSIGTLTAGIAQSLNNSRLMEERGIAHTTSECTLRAFTCGDVDPMAATPAEIEKLRAVQIGHRVDGIVGGLAVDEESRDGR
jgi:hypothetical protein